ncbi:transcriptional regulator domain-containing protein [Bradyrhizobium sp. USDA 223]|uniref:transcriptional regulator domain-containing protein n=1 Tax=Bradyrhizobium sp. USDA 223 TaxID=3156306 RepID=UPI00384FC316
MPDTNWRSAEAYTSQKKADAADLASELLRRDRDYQQDYRRLSRRERSSVAAGQFRGKWGLSFSC